jgi:hypothetical protein
MNEITTASTRALFASGGAFMLMLLFAHPHEAVHTFADVVDFEIRHRRVNEIVHGSTIALLGLLLVAHIAATRQVDKGNLLLTAAATAFGGGCVLMTASLVLDGFVTPALAAQYLGATQDPMLQRSIEALVRFCNTSIRTLMPMALLAFAFAALAWCGPLVRLPGRNRIVGTLSGVIGTIIILLILAASPTALNHALMGSLFLMALWQLALAFQIFPRTSTRA